MKKYLGPLVAGAIAAGTAGCNGNNTTINGDVNIKAEIDNLEPGFNDKEICIIQTPDGNITVSTDIYNQCSEIQDEISYLVKYPDIISFLEYKKNQYGDKHFDYKLPDYNNTVIDRPIHNPENSENIKFLNFDDGTKISYEFFENENKLNITILYGLFDDNMMNLKEIGEKVLIEELKVPGELYYIEEGNPMKFIFSVQEEQGKNKYRDKAYEAYFKFTG